MNAKPNLSVVDFSSTRVRQRDPEVNNKAQPAPTPEPKATSILDPRFKYSSSAATDLKAKFKALGFKTPKPQRPKFGK